MAGLADPPRCVVQHAQHYRYTLRPFFLGGVMHASGNQPPATVPAKGKHLFVDLARNGRFLGMTLAAPSRFPIKSLLAMRCLTAIQQLHPASLVPACRALWRAYWGGQDCDIAVPAVIGAVLLAGTTLTREQVAAVLAAANSDAVKAQLTRNTEEAIALGAFGAPTLVLRTTPQAEPQLFFGSDRFHLIFHELGKAWVAAPKQYGKLPSKL